MQKILLFTLFIISTFSLPAQYYIRGEVKDENNQPLSNVKIYLHSNHLLYYSGNDGGFGILSAKLNDTLTLNADSYEPKSIAVRSDAYQHVILKMLSASVSVQKQRLISITGNFEKGGNQSGAFGNESYSNLIENNFIKAEKFRFN